jgi:hypothetical protein
MWSKPPSDADVKVEIYITKSQLQTLRRYESTFHQNSEKAILQRIPVLEVPTFGFEICDILKLKSDLAEENEVWHWFNTYKRMVGWNWLIDFRKRLPEIYLCRAEPTSANRAQTFNRPQVQKCFSLLLKLCRREIFHQHEFIIWISQLWQQFRNQPKWLLLKAKATKYNNNKSVLQ